MIRPLPWLLLLLALGNVRSASALNVPFLPQTEGLCGGAAVAMVYRYWGDTHADPQQFKSLVDRRAGGIPNDLLVRTVRGDGWQAAQSSGSIGELKAHLDAGHPVVVLLAERARLYHYVVATDTGEGTVVVHDPSRGPSRVLSEGAFSRAWQATGNWSLVILPTPSLPSAPLPPSSSVTIAASAASALSNEKQVQASAPELDVCDRAVADAMSRIKRGDPASVERIMASLRDDCRDSPAALRELAGVRFSEHRWAEAADLATRAVEGEPGDAYGWDLLGSSRFMQDDLGGALDAWNQIGKPRVDRIDVEGIERTHYTLVVDALDIPTGEVLTAERFRLAARRLRELPNRSSTRISYRPQLDGFAVVDVMVSERNALPRGRVGWALEGLETAIDRQVSIDVPGSTGQGELWSASWRFWPNRPRVGVAFSAPHVGWLPGVWRVDGNWEAQTYAFGGVTTREERYHGGITMGSWLTSNIRYELGAGIDSWADSRRAASFGVSLQRRLMNDQLTLAANATTWRSLTNDPAFNVLGARADFRFEPGSFVYIARLGVQSASESAPLEFWSGAGQGPGRSRLLRAHRLISHGTIEGEIFGRRLEYMTLEAQRWFKGKLKVPIGVAAFADAANAAHRPAAVTIDPLQVDAGVGMRIRIPGRTESLRIDFARGLRDGSQAVTLGWRY